MLLHSFPIKIYSKHESNKFDCKLAHVNPQHLVLFLAVARASFMALGFPYPPKAALLFACFDAMF